MSKPLLVLITEYIALTQLRKLLSAVSWSRPALYFHVYLLHSDPFGELFYKVKVKLGPYFSCFFLTEIKANKIVLETLRWY